MEKRNIWLRFLQMSSLFVLLTGLLPSLAIFESTQEPWRLFFDVLSWPLDHAPAGFSATEKQLSAVLGGVLCGWAWLMYALAQPLVFNEKIRKVMVQSTWVWFGLDSVGSVLAGLSLNAVSNLVFLLLLLVPLSKLKRAQEAYGQKGS